MKTGISNSFVSKNLISIGYLGFLFLCMVELKTIYWGGLDWSQLKTVTNITLFICFFIIPQCVKKYQLLIIIVEIILFICK